MDSVKTAFCPKCLAPLEAKDFFSSGGISDWRVESAGVVVTCPHCGYSGPPAEADSSEYKKAAPKNAQ